MCDFSTQTPVGLTEDGPVNASGHRRLAKLLLADGKPTITRSIAHYSQGMQNSIPENIEREALQQKTTLSAAASR